MDGINVNNENHALAPPDRILGYLIRSPTKIYISYIIPSVLATFVYIVQFVADCAVSYKHFRNHQPEFGAATLSLILVPPILTFILLISSKDHRENLNADWRRCLVYSVLQTLLFPFFALYRFAVRIFWSVEALFQDENDAERMLCLEKSTECSGCELYLLIQAYAQAAPQIILQMYQMLMQDLFRDYQTTTVQAICLVFSTIDLAAITTSYQRFESQRLVGRAYPWATPNQIKAQRQLLECNARLRHECACRKRDSERILHRFPESEVIMKNFKMQKDEKKNGKNTAKTHTVEVRGLDEVDNEGIGDLETTALIHRPIEIDKPAIPNATDDDKIRSYPNSPNIALSRTSRHGLGMIDEIISLDTVPDSPPPPLPTARILRNQQSQKSQIDIDRSSSKGTHQHKRSSRTISIPQLETLKDMLMVNAQLYIKDHIPHPPKILLQRIEKDSEDKQTSAKSFRSSLNTHRPQDEIDFFLPRPTRIVNGIEQEDFVARSIAFLGWIAYIAMRLLSLATFCYFYPKPFFILIGVHYGVMLIALCVESRFKGRINIFLFYPILAYVFIFVLMEFRIKFKRIRLWYVGYFLVTMSENIVMTIVWNTREEFESWWFQFITESIVYSGCLFVGTLIVYYILLKPKDVVLIVEDNSTS